MLGRKRRGRILFMMLVFALLLILPLHPVLAQETDVYDTTYSVAYHELPYGNGKDDDGDGVIDNLEEDDVQYGNVSLNDTRSLIYQWNDTGFSSEWNDGVELVENGIAIAPVYDQLWEIQASANASINAINNACYIYETDDQHMWEQQGSLGGAMLVEEKMLPLLRYYVEFSPEDVMNGAQQIWFRSPIAYDDTKYDGHILNIYREEDNVLVWSNMNESDMTPFHSRRHRYDYPVIKKDNSTVGEGSPYYRIYYRLNFPLRSGMTYRIEEFVKLDVDNPVNSVVLYMAAHQDIADDGHQTTYVFPYSDNSRMLPQECSWSVLFKYGIGPVGTEFPILSKQGGGQPIVWSQPIRGSMNAVESVTVIVPLRAEANMGKVEIALHTMSGDDSHSDEVDIFDASGTLYARFDINDNDNSEINYYELELIFHDWTEGDVGDEKIVCITIYPADGEAVVIQQNGNMSSADDIFLSNFGMHWEILEHADPVPVEEATSTSDLTGWIGIAVFLIGVALIVLAPAIGFAIMHAGVSTALSIGIGAAVLAGGVYTANLGMQFMTGRNLIGEFLTWAGNGVARIVSGLIEGVVMIGGAIIAGIVQVVEALMSIGSAIFHYAGIILMIISEIIYFIAFLFVMMGWVIFLNTMKYVMHGEFEMAWKQFKNPVIRAYKTTAKAVRFASSVATKGVSLGSGLVGSTETGSRLQGAYAGAQARRQEQLSGSRMAGRTEGYDWASRRYSQSNKRKYGGIYDDMDNKGGSIE